MLKLTAHAEAVLFAVLVLAMALGLSLLPGDGIALHGWTPALAVVTIAIVPHCSEAAPLHSALPCPSRPCSCSP